MIVITDKETKPKVMKMGHSEMRASYDYHLPRNKLQKSSCERDSRSALKNIYIIDPNLSM